MGSGQIPYRASVQANDPLTSEHLFAISRQRCRWFGFSSQFGVKPHPAEDLSDEHRSSVQPVTHLGRVRTIRARDDFTVGIGDPAGPLLSGTLGTPSACLDRLSQLHRENPSEYPIVQALLDGTISRAGATHAAPVHPGALDRSLVAQRV